MQLLVLMWKLAISRYKRYFQTASEIVFCIFSFYLIYLFSMDSLGPPADIGKSESINPRNIISHDIFVFPQNARLQVVYYPRTNFTDNLMNLVGNKLKIKKIDTLKGTGYYGTNNMSFIDSYLKDINDKKAVISFENMPKQDLPEKLTYAIRCVSQVGDFMINTIESDPTYISYPGFGKVYEKFMHLQWAVDTAFIELKNGSPVTQTVSFKEFDSYSYASTDDMAFVALVNIIFNAFSLMLVYMFHIGRIVEDRISGVQALLSMSGVSSFMLSVSHFLNGMAFGVIHMTAVMICYFVKGSKGIIYYSNPFLVFIVFLLYYISILMFGFLTAFALPSMKLILAAALGIYFTTLLPLISIPVHHYWNMHVLILFGLGLVPHQPLYFFLVIILQMEVKEEGLQFNNFFDRTDIMYMSPFVVLSMMILQILLYGGIAYYLSLVNPGKYVNPLPWRFLCMKDFWKKKVSPDIEMAEVTQPLQEDSQYFEQGPPDSEVGIQVIDVSKVYGNNRVLSNLSMKIYKGEITVLLGHNGAGKTTILSIISGMSKATSGKVLINGLDTVKYRRNILKSIGVCPQENMFFKDLSVMQHIMFFTMLRTNVGFKKAKEMSMELLKELFLSEKHNSPVHKLSGGMMRRVQLGCALAGNADILILDEPTSGLDVETRRELWDLLLSLRGNRTVLLTTHFMEEADVLGDRVAALHNGQLRCHATPDYLKKAVGKGYILTLVTLGSPKTNEITEVVTSKVPEAILAETTLNCVTFNLPPETTNKFPAMFHSLEDNRELLGIESIGVGTATLEEVFLILCSDVDVQFTKDTIDGVRQDVEYEKVKGSKLRLQQLKALFNRQLKYIYRRKYSFFFIQILLLCLLVINLSTSNEASNSPPTHSLLDLSMYKPLLHKNILLDIDEPTLKKLEPKFRAAYEDYDFINVNDINKVALDSSLIDPSEYKKYIIGLKVNNESAQVFYTTWVRHAAPVALNFLTNLLAGEEHTISVFNEPARLTDETGKIKEITSVHFISVTIGIVILAWLAYITILMPRERTSGTRHIFLMFGCPAIMYWLFTWIYHALLNTIFMIIPSIILVYALEGKLQTQDDPDYLWTVFVVCFVGTFAVLSLLYFCSMQQQDSKYYVVCTVLIAIFGYVLPFIYIVIKYSKKEIYQTLEVIDYVLPVFTFPNALIATGRIAHNNTENKNKKCSKNKSYFKECYASTPNPNCFLCPEKGTVFTYVLILFIQAIVYMVLVILMQKGIFEKLWDWITNKKYQELKATSEDSEALEEINYVGNAMNLPQSKVFDAMLVHQVHKRFALLFRPSIEAVKGVSISVKKGECFGLVGVNGAGKTTLFNMIVASSHTTRGVIMCNGIRASRIKEDYVRQLGFCPQHHSLDHFLTGEENLTFLLKLKGLKSEDIKKEVNFWISILALEKHRKKVTSSYSGGCRRRVSAAAALMAAGPATLLDEPSAGVDVAARRALWMALKAGQRGGRSVVVSSHSMEEIEALCGRVCILVAGEVRALAAPSEMRRRYATGHTLHINIASDTTATEQIVEQLKADVVKSFECTLDDSNRSMLHYHITQTMKYSDIFSAVENLKSRYPLLIQDYTVKEPTLEQVFLSFAKQNKTQKNNTSSNAAQSTAACV